MTLTPSKRMQAAAAAELKRINAKLAKVDAKADRLIAALEAVQAERTELGEVQAGLLRLAGDMLQQERAATVPDSRALRGAAIRETAVRILAARWPTEKPIHYRDWYALLVNEGYAARGKDPLATFLTNISRSPVVQSTTRAGEYVLDPGFIRRAQERHAHFAAQIAALSSAPSATVQDLVATREQRDRLAHELAVLERDLAEALRCLPGPGTREGATDTQAGTLQA